MAISFPEHEKKPRKKKPRFPGLSCERGDGARTRDPQLGKPTQHRMDKRFPHNHAESHPLRPARVRSGRVVTGAQLARTNEPGGPRTTPSHRGASVRIPYTPLDPF
jgi:hypothetical protein